MEVYNDFYTKARAYGKKTVADQLTQMALSKMEPRQTFVLASINGVKYFKCVEPPKDTTKIWIDECEEIKP